MPPTMLTADSTNSKWDRSFFGHPRGLSTLFFTEMWERFSYYGMRALLILFMVATVDHGGLGFPASRAASVYGLYTSMVYLLALPGGWIADKIIGQRKAVLWGGIVIACGHFAMAVPSLQMFYLGLAFIVIGTGLLKPNISTMVGGLYRMEDNRRDAGFSIFYIGINIGGFAAPLVCGYLGENINWHYGFGAAGVGMTLGLIQYTLGGRYLGRAGLEHSGTEKPTVASHLSKCCVGGHGRGRCRRYRWWRCRSTDLRICFGAVLMIAVVILLLRLVAAVEAVLGVR